MVHHPEFLRQGHVMVQEKRRAIAGNDNTIIGALYTCSMIIMR